MSFFENKNVLITGSCGSVGSELVSQLLSMEKGPGKLIGLDNNESEIFFQDQAYIRDVRANFYVSDLRDANDLADKMRGVDYVFHCAALKHVVLCERSPSQAVSANIIGVQNIVWAAKQARVKRVLFTSSDKAVNPTNVMGTTKLMGERLMSAANVEGLRDSEPTIFASTRFGNVLGSRGSVVPIFKKQIQQGGPVTVTDIAMTRFVMSIEQSVKLVLNSIQLAVGGEIFVTKMPVVRVLDIAKVLIERSRFDVNEIEIKEIGTKPGEKLYEELMSDEETRRSIELKDFFVVLPAFSGIYKSFEYSYKDEVSRTVNNPYNSSNEVACTQEEVDALLLEYGLLSIKPASVGARYWPGDSA